MANIISKAEIIAEVNRLNPLDYIKAYTSLKHIQIQRKPSQKTNSALDNLFSLEGCLQDCNLTSVELQKNASKLWSSKYEID